MPTIVDDWAELDTQYVTLEPSEEEIAGWKLLKTVNVTLTPSEEEVAGWKLLDTKTITLTPSEVEIPGEWELVHSEKTGVGLWYIGKAEQCTFEFTAPPEQIPGVKWLIGKLGSALKTKVEAEGGKVLEYKLYFDKAGVATSRWKVVITAHASPLAWSAIIIAALVLATIVVIAWILHDVKDLWWFGWAVIATAGAVTALAIGGTIYLLKRKKEVSKATS